MKEGTLAPSCKLGIATYVSHLCWCREEPRVLEQSSDLLAHCCYHDLSETLLCYPFVHALCIAYIEMDRSTINWPPCIFFEHKAHHKWMVSEVVHRIPLAKIKF